MNWFLIWYIIGFISMLPMFIEDINQNGRMSLGDIAMVLLMSCCGPIITICSSRTYIEYIVNIFEKLFSISIWERKQ